MAFHGVMCSALEMGADDALPTTFLIFKAGKNPTSKGVFLFDAKAARAVMARYQQDGVDLIVDREHASLSQAARASRADAADALAHYRLDLKPDGSLWACDVVWTPAGAEDLRLKKRRYISPAFDDDKSGRITYVLNVGLVSMPATFGAAPLVAAGAFDTCNGALVELCKALIVHAATQSRKKVKTHGSR